MPDDRVRFLVVDDLSENLLGLEGLLRRDGLDIVFARSGPEALEHLLVQDFALALIDVQMPGMDGFELAELMRGTERTRHIPIIFITAVASDEQRRFRGYELGAIDYLTKPIETQVLRNKADLYFRLDRKRRDLLHQREELRQLQQRLAAHTDNSPLATIEFDDEFRITYWSAGAERIFGWSAEEVAGKQIGQLRWMHEEDVEAIAAFNRRFLASTVTRDVHLNRNYRKDGSLLYCEWYNSALLNEDGKLTSVRSQVLDVTERKRAEDHRELLLRELGHRVKNTLATVQAIASQTFKEAELGAAATRAFHGRLSALSSAHDILLQRQWQSADLLEVVEKAVSPYRDADRGRIEIEGPTVKLVPRSALAFAMGLHELCTNAAKYGALSEPRGLVSIRWKVLNGASPPQLQMCWKEMNGPAVEKPKHSGFGSRLIKRLLESELNAEVTLDYRADGLVCVIHAPHQVAFEGIGANGKEACM